MRLQSWLSFNVMYVSQEWVVAACGHCHGETCSKIGSPKEATVALGPNSFVYDFDFMNDWDVIDKEVVDSEDFGLF